ncbi:cell wall protein RTB1-like [Gymnodraco acuticeps]|uniref:Cell wall protein RTB1-like n=1 Tax=Gymnodraco acuticeps TaxID=8218 RepID=A0A6P8UWG7_GYMAC|nr:cell wall protein RTB1-like [Gymnodraco acuticeps]
MTEAPTTAASPTFVVTAALSGETFIDAYNNNTSPEYKRLETKLISTCSKIYKPRFPNTFSHCKVKKLRPVEVRATETEAELAVVFDSTTATADLPQNSEVTQVLVEAVTNTSNNFDVSITPASVTIISSPFLDTTAAPTTAAPATAAPTTAAPTTAAPTTEAPTTASPTTAAPTTAAPTTAAPMTEAPTTAASPTFVVTAALSGETFIDAYNNNTSPEYKRLETKLISTCSKIYKPRFPNTFSHCKVKKLRPVEVRATETEAELAVVFDSTTATADLPQNSEVTQVLVEAVTNTSNNFDVSITPASVTIISSPFLDTTVAPTTAAPTTARPATAAPTTIALITKRVTFRSVQDTFTNELLNPSSAAYKARATMINTQLTPVFKREFPSSFKSLDVVSFSNGSIITIIDLSFESTSAPTSTQIANALINAASTVLGFDIEGSSIGVNGISSSGVRHKISLVTAPCLLLLSWLLLNQQ